MPSHTFIATWLAVSATGARPVPVEPEDGSFVIGAAAVEAAISARTAAILPVHLYGQPADMPALARLAARHSLALVADAAQAHGARVGGHPVGAWGDAASWSFYPAKNLGALGDGGADHDRRRRARSTAAAAPELRLGSQVRPPRTGREQPPRRTPGRDSRVRLTRLEEWNERRATVAESYTALLRDCGLELPPGPGTGDVHAWHLYVVRSRHRDDLAEALRAAGVGSLVHYPIPCHRQGAYASSRVAATSLEIADRYAGQVLSLPIGPHLAAEQVERVVRVVQSLEHCEGGLMRWIKQGLLYAPDGRCRGRRPTPSRRRRS